MDYQFRASFGRNSSFSLLSDQVVPNRSDHQTEYIFGLGVGQGRPGPAMPEILSFTISRREPAQVWRISIVTGELNTELIFPASFAGRVEYPRVFWPTRNQFNGPQISRRQRHDQFQSFVVLYKFGSFVALLHLGVLDLQTPMLRRQCYRS